MRHATAAVAIGVAVAAAIFRVLTMSGFSNDHFVILTPAAQMLLGEWPVRDFVDPGMPLMYGMSAVAHHDCRESGKSGNIKRRPRATRAARTLHHGRARR